VALVLLPGRRDRGVADLLSRALPRIGALPDGLRRSLGAAWGCEVFDHWGMTGTGFGGGVERAAHSGYHLREAAAWLSGPCPCGGPLRRLGRVPGRIAANGAIVHPRKGGGGT